MKNIKSFDQMFEAKKVSVDINAIKSDLEGFRPGGGGDSQPAEVNGDQASKSFRHLGNWMHDEERDYDEDDQDWREDDDQMIWANGEYKKYFKVFTDWASTKPWFSNVKLGLETSEKNWVEFTITVNK